MIRSTALLGLVAALLGGCVGEAILKPGADGGPACEVRLEPVSELRRTVATGGQVELAVVWHDTCAGPLSGSPVTFTVDGAAGGATLSAAEVATDAAGIARVLLTGGAPSSFSVTARHVDHAAAIVFSVDVTTAACANHCTSGAQDCGETGVDCGGGCAACASGGGAGGGAAGGGAGGGSAGGGSAGGGSAGGGTGGGAAGGGSGGGAAGGGTGGAAGGTGGGAAGTDGATIVSHTLPTAMSCGASASATVTLRNSGTSTWITTTANPYRLGYVGDVAAPFLPPGATPRVELPSTVAPGATVTLPVQLRAPALAGTFDARFQMLEENVRWFGAVAASTITVSCSASTSCTFPQGVPDAEFVGHTDTSASVANTVNTVMEQLSGCGRGSDCYIGDRYPTGQSWFDAVNTELRARGLCAGQHEEGYTDEIAVSDTGCAGLWYGYHIYNYGGLKVVWNPGAQRGSWSIPAARCP